MVNLDCQNALINQRDRLLSSRVVDLICDSSDKAGNMEFKRLLLYIAVLTIELKLCVGCMSR